MYSLVIDDEIVARSKVHAALSRYGDVQVASDGAEALELFAAAIRGERPFELVTIDIQLPDANGLKLLLDFNRMEARAGVQPAKKIMVTAEGTTYTVKQALRFHCDDFLVKPFHRDALARKLEAFGFAPPPEVGLRGAL